MFAFNLNYQIECLPVMTKNMTDLIQCFEKEMCKGKKKEHHLARFKKSVM